MKSLCGVQAKAGGGHWRYSHVPRGWGEPSTQRESRVLIFISPGLFIMLFEAAGCPGGIIDQKSHAASQRIFQSKRWRRCGKTLRSFRGYAINFSTNAIGFSSEIESTVLRCYCRIYVANANGVQITWLGRAVLRSLQSDSPRRSLAFTT
jgi:hypothetical protein